MKTVEKMKLTLALTNMIQCTCKMSERRKRRRKKMLEKGQACNV